MSSFLAATLATFAQPTPFEGRPSEKNRSTTGLAKLWIATCANIPRQGIHGKGKLALRLGGEAITAVMPKYPRIR